MEHVSARYRGEDEGYVLDEAMLRRALIAQFLRRGPVSVVVGPIEVQIAGDTAVARFEAVLSEGTGRGLDIVPVGMDGWSLEVQFAKEDGEWKVSGHRRVSLRGAAARP
jgi:hypothetical protein